MKVLNLKLKNFGSFDEAELSFDKINLIVGYNFDTGAGNGSGKTTLISALLFALFGEKALDKKLGSLVQKGKEKCKVSVIVQVDETLLEITREYPTKVELRVNDELLELAGNTEKQNKICQLIGDVEEFKRLRILDKSKGVNVLDFAPRQLKKTLMGFAEDKFENIRSKLLKIKTEREKFNKDQVIYKHAPSECRLSILKGSKNRLEDKELSIIEANLEELNDKYGDFRKKQGEISSTCSHLEGQINKLKSLAECPTCLQRVPEEHKNSIINEWQKTIQQSKELLEKHTKEIKVIIDEIEKYRIKEKKIKDNLNKINSLLLKLETRLKQKDYKYTEKDILLVKKAIEVIDHFASYYVVEWVKIVEPIVNSHIDKLDMQLKFIVDDKQNISVEIDREGEKFAYEELSTGEKIFVSFVFNIALLIQEQKKGLLIADEGLDSLSPENIERILSIVDDIPMQLICISQHRDLNIGNVKTIHVEKREGTSKIGGTN